MGGCLSGNSSPILQGIEGVVIQSRGEDAYHERFMEDVVLGQGEFGQVKLVHDMKAAAAAAAKTPTTTNGDASHQAPMACKILPKGMTFKDNTIYSPIKPEVLRGEVEILKTLQGQQYCLKMVAVYESPRNIYIVTEFCGGGAMMEYISQQTQDLRTEDVSRLAFQLLSAVNHCDKHRVLHRDIKPENIMFVDPSPNAPMRLIDFGSGCLEKETPPKGDPNNPSSNPAEANAPKMHSTFAGSAFYISPEMFQRTYTQKTDVWSAGVTLYVLVAGYPASALQKAFNILQTATGRNLKELPGLPSDMPDSYYEMLDGLLTHQHKKRPTAEQMLQCEFVQFHKVLLEQEKDGAPLSFEEISMAAHAAAFEDGTAEHSKYLYSNNNLSKGRTASIRLTGSVVKHSIFLDFQKFERSLTALLATMLSKPQLEQLTTLLQERINQQINNNTTTTPDKNDTLVTAPAATRTTKTKEGDQQMRLEVILVKELRSILEQDELHCDPTVLETMENLPHYKLYGSFAYHVTLLQEFLDAGKPGTSPSGAGRRRGSFKRTSSFASLRPGIRFMTGSNRSVRSAGSMRGGAAAAAAAATSQSQRAANRIHPSNNNNNNSSSKAPHSVHGSNVFTTNARKIASGEVIDRGSTNTNTQSMDDDTLLLSTTTTIALNDNDAACKLDSMEGNCQPAGAEDMIDL